MAIPSKERVIRAIRGTLIRKTPLPADIQARLGTLGRALEKCPGVMFAYVFGGAAAGRLGPLSDVDVAV